MLHWSQRFSGFTLAGRLRSDPSIGRSGRGSTWGWELQSPAQPSLAPSLLPHCSHRKHHFVFFWVRRSRSRQDPPPDPHRCQLDPPPPRTRSLQWGRYWIWKGVLVRCSSYCWSIGWFHQMKRSFSPEDCSTWHFDIRSLKVCVNI